MLSMDEHVTNGQMHIGRWVENVTNGRMDECIGGKKGTDGLTNGKLFAKVRCLVLELSPQERLFVQWPQPSNSCELLVQTVY